MPALVKRDGKLLSVQDDENAAFAWLLSHQGQSVDWACKYEGYSIEPYDSETVEAADGIIPQLKPGTLVLIRLKGRTSHDIIGRIVGPYTLDVMPGTVIDMGEWARSDFKEVAVGHHTIDKAWIDIGGSA